MDQWTRQLAVGSWIGFGFGVNCAGFAVVPNDCHAVVPQCIGLKESLHSALAFEVAAAGS